MYIGVMRKTFVAATFAPALMQFVRHRQVVGPDRMVQRGGAVRVRAVHLSALAQQHTHCGNVRASGSLDETLIRTGRVRQRKHHRQRHHRKDSRPDHHVPPTLS